MRFNKLEPESFDMPLGFKTGAGVIFGNSGGVSEAVLRYAAEKVTGEPLKNPDFHAVRGEGGCAWPPSRWMGCSSSWRWCTG